MKNKLISFGGLTVSVGLLALASSCAPKSDSSVDMQIMVKAKEDIDKLNHNVETLQGSVSSLSTKIEAMDKTVAGFKPASNEEGMADISKELKSIKSSLADVEIQLKKVAAMDTGGGASKNVVDSGGTQPGGQGTGSSGQTTGGGSSKSGGQGQPSGKTSDPLGIATEKHTVDMRQPGSGGGTDSGGGTGSGTQPPPPAPPSGDKPMPADQTFKVDLRKPGQ
jgi:hypothetical protein